MNNTGLLPGLLATACSALAMSMAMISTAAESTETQQAGPYFQAKAYEPTPLPAFANYRDQLPQPIFDRRPDYIEFYYRAWEIGFEHFKQPPAGSPLVKNFIDEAFNENIFLWDMSFSTMWANYAHSIFPGIEGLDNFYALQMANGEIVREIGEADGKLGVAGWSEPGTAGNLNHPMAAWAELKAYRITADIQRLARVYPALRAYRESYRQIYHAPSGLYLTDKGAMDDSPRNEELLAGIDVAAEMVIFDLWLAEIAEVLERSEQVAFYQSRAQQYAQFLNERLWDEETGFYYDWGRNGERMNIRTIAAFWPMLGGIPSEAQLERLIGHLNDPQGFNTPHRVPTHPKNEVGYTGDYWAGAVWAPTNTMVIAGLEKYGRYELAHEIAMSHLNAATEVFNKTNTAWENYYPEAWEKGRKAKPDFVGWSGLAPITYLIEHALGFRIDAPANQLDWTPRELGRHGIQGLRYRLQDGGWNTVSIIAKARSSAEAALEFEVRCERDFTLRVASTLGAETYAIDCSQLAPMTLSGSSDNTASNRGRISIAANQTNQ